MFNRLMSTYGFDGVHEFLLSLLPSFKYNFGAASVGTSVVAGFLSHYFGLTPWLVVVMGVAVLVEMITGIKASNKAGKPFESFKFSRGILKICVWCVIFFIFNAFALEMRTFEGWPYACAAVMFQILHCSAMVWFVIENGTSILENQAVIDGKSKTQYIEAVKTFWSAFINVLKGKMNG